MHKSHGMAQELCEGCGTFKKLIVTILVVQDGDNPIAQELVPNVPVGLFIQPVLHISI